VKLSTVFSLPALSWLIYEQFVIIIMKGFHTFIVYIKLENMELWIKTDHKTGRPTTIGLQQVLFSEVCEVFMTMLKSGVYKNANYT